MESNSILANIQILLLMYGIITAVVGMLMAALGFLVRNIKPVTLANPHGSETGRYGVGFERIGTIFFGCGILLIVIYFIIALIR